MGVNARLFLPCNTAIENVATAIGILAGLPANKRVLPNIRPNAWYVAVPGVEMESCNTPSLVMCAMIKFVTPNGVPHVVIYHFETETGERLLMPRSTPFWCAVLTGLWNFFGGRLQYGDYDDKMDLVTKVNYDINPRTDEPWQSFQERLFNLTPANPDDFKDVAAY
jgi:hypothetical protein